MKNAYLIFSHFYGKISENTNFNGTWNMYISSDQLLIIANITKQNKKEVAFY